jgi:hypothetical protein
MLEAEVDDMGRIELPAGANIGYMRVNGERRPLPAGSSLSAWRPDIPRGP